MKMNLSVCSAVLACALAIGSSPVIAAEWCGGSVSNLYIQNTGEVFVRPSFRNDYVQVCNVNSEWKGVGTLTCMSWLSLLRSATSRTGASMIFNYAEPTACTALPTYENAPAPVYIMLNN